MLLSARIIKSLLLLIGSIASCFLFDLFQFRLLWSLRLLWEVFLPVCLGNEAAGTLFPSHPHPRSLLSSKYWQIGKREPKVAEEANDGLVILMHHTGVTLIWPSALWICFSTKFTFSCPDIWHTVTLDLFLYTPFFWFAESYQILVQLSAKKLGMV